jgi:hypothetical protein
MPSSGATYRRVNPRGIDFAWIFLDETNRFMSLLR